MIDVMWEEESTRGHLCTEGGHMCAVRRCRAQEEGDLLTSPCSTSSQNCKKEVPMFQPPSPQYFTMVVSRQTRVYGWSRSIHWPENLPAVMWRERQTGWLLSCAKLLWYHHTREGRHQAPSMITWNTQLRRNAHHWLLPSSASWLQPTLLICQ